MEKVGIGVDVGGTSIKLGLFQPDGTILKKWEFPTDTSENGTHVLPDIADSIRKTMEETFQGKAELIGVGIGVPGPVQPTGYVEVGVNLHRRASSRSCSAVSASRSETMRMSRRSVRLGAAAVRARPMRCF